MALCVHSTTLQCRAQLLFLLLEIMLIVRNGTGGSAEVLVGVIWVIILRYNCTFTVDDVLTAATKDPTSCVAINGIVTIKSTHNPGAPTILEAFTIQGVLINVPNLAFLCPVEALAFVCCLFVRNIFKKISVKQLTTSRKREGAFA